MNESHPDIDSLAEHDAISPRSLANALQQLTCAFCRLVAPWIRHDQRFSAHAPARTTLDWGRNYLPNHFAKPPSALHCWLGEQLDEMRDKRGTKVNLIGPRGSAKSTIATLSYVLQAAVTRSERYIWIVSDTMLQAQLPSPSSLDFSL